MKIWARFKKLFKSKKLQRRSTIPWYYLNKSNKKAGKRTERSISEIYFTLTGKQIGGKVPFIKLYPKYIKCLKIK